MYISSSYAAATLIAASQKSSSLSAARTNERRGAILPIDVVVRHKSGLSLSLSLLAKKNDTQPPVHFRSGPFLRALAPTMVVSSRVLLQFTAVYSAYDLYSERQRDAALVPVA
jgi:hypothetical protein